MTSSAPVPDPAKLLPQVQDALERLHDLPALRAHPLATTDSNDNGNGNGARGQHLQTWLLQAVEALAPAQASGAAGERAMRRARLMHLRYVEGLEIDEILRQLNISRSQYFRVQREGVQAVADGYLAAHRETLSVGGIGEPSADTRKAPAAVVTLRPQSRVAMLAAAALVLPLMVVALLVLLPTTPAPAPAAAPALAVPPDRQPATVSFQPGSNAVDVFDPSGRFLWKAAIDAQLIKALVADLDGDGANEVVLGGEVGKDRAAKDIGTIHVYEHTGELRWRYEVPANYPYEGDRSGRLTIRDFLVAPLLGSAGREIAFIANDTTWYPAKVGVLTARGELRGEYWHPGHLGVLHTVQRDGRPRLLVGGLNNDFRNPALLGNGGARYFGVAFLLDPTRLTGEAPPFAGRHRTGTHEWYLRIEPQGVTIDDLLLRDRLGQGALDITVELDCGHFIYLSLEARVTGEAPGDGYKCTAPPRVEVVSWGSREDVDRFVATR